MAVPDAPAASLNVRAAGTTLAHLCAPAFNVTFLAQLALLIEAANERLGARIVDHGVVVGRSERSFDVPALTRWHERIDVSVASRVARAWLDRPYDVARPAPPRAASSDRSGAAHASRVAIQAALELALVLEHRDDKETRRVRMAEVRSLMRLAPEDGNWVLERRGTAEVRRRLRELPEAPLEDLVEKFRLALARQPDGDEVARAGYVSARSMRSKLSSGDLPLDAPARERYLAVVDTFFELLGDDTGMLSSFPNEPVVVPDPERSGRIGGAVVVRTAARWRDAFVGALDAAPRLAHLAALVPPLDPEGVGPLLMSPAVSAPPPARDLEQEVAAGLRDLEPDDVRRRAGDLLGGMAAARPDLARDCRQHLDAVLDGTTGTPDTQVRAFVAAVLATIVKEAT